MKKYLFLAVAACLGLASCEDVPAPYEIFTNGENPNGGGHVTAVAEGDGSAENPFNVAAVNDFDPGAGVTTSESYYVRGKISQLKEFGESYGNYSYYISDDGSTKNQYYIYRGYDLDGAKFTSADQLAVGDSVVIYGKIVNYNGTLEYAQGSRLVYHNGQTAGTSPEPPSDLGDNLIANGDFESWTDGLPTEWKSACTASSATLSQSEDAHGGKYAVKVAGADQNKRLAYKELNLKAGTYYVTYYAKSGGECTSSYGRQCRSGYVPVTNGSVGSYTYGDYISLTESDWTKAEFSFKLTAAQTVCLVIMAPANCGDLFVDDFELKTADGGFGEGGSVTPSDPVDANTPETAYTVAKAHQLIEGGAGLDNMVYVKGFISEIQEVSTSYGNATYFISDDKSTTGQLEVYRGYGLGGAKFTSESEIKVGDEVIVYGKLVDYNGTHEFTTGSQIYSLNGQTAGTENPDQPGTDPDQPSGDVQQITIGEFLTKADPNTTYRLVGIVKNIANTTYGNFDLVDATGSIYIYGLLNAAGQDKQFASMGIKEGDELTLEGAYFDYNGKAEIKNAQYISHKAGSGVDPDQPGDEPGTPDVSGDCLTFDMSANCFGIPSDKQSAADTYSCGDYSITLTPAGKDNTYYYNSSSKYVILGKQGATLEFNGFDFDVAKIEITGRDGASASITQNIFVGDEAVSTETTGAKGTNTYVIKEGYRTAGTHYVLRVTSNHNTQFTEIKVYKAQ